MNERINGILISAELNLYSISLFKNIDKTTKTVLISIISEINKLLPPIFIKIEVDTNSYFPFERCSRIKIGPNFNNS